MTSAGKPSSVLFMRSYVLRRRLKQFVERLLDVKVQRVLPLGTNVHTDIEQSLPGHRVLSVLDVGANIGQTAAQFSFWHPDVAIYCVEPVRANFEELQRNTANIPRVRCFQLGLADAPGSAEMLLAGPSSTYRVGSARPATDAASETVVIDTVDGLCSRLGLDKLGYLKIDTEGHDLKVLQGASALLSRGGVDFVEVEAGMNPTNALHVPFEALKAFLEQHGYLLFGMYEQRHDWPTGRPILRRCNAVFIAPRLADTQRGSAS
jgi:FkbM family methyltransferase